MRLMIIGRDGVINFASNNYIKSEGEWLAIPGSLEAIARLNHLGCKVAVVTYCTGLESGALDLLSHNAIIKKMHGQLARVGGHIDGVFFPQCKKASGTESESSISDLLLEIGSRFRLSLSDVPVVVSERKLFASVEQVGARPILIEADFNNDRIPTVGAKDTEKFSNLMRAVDTLVSEATA